MSSATDFAQLCRLCLVKEQVNVDIFEEPDNIRQIFHKISTCLPVKLSKEDKLPKRICEGCLYKLNIAYQFWNTSVNAEKQLLQWLKQSTRKSEADFPEKVKEEIDVPGNEIENIEDFLETSLTDVNTGKSETCVENVPESSDDEPLAKRRRRLRAQTRAAPPKPAEVIVGKVELNETDGDDNSDDPDDPNYLPDGVDMSDDNEQPGPSGLGTSTSDIPSIHQDESKKRFSDLFNLYNARKLTIKLTDIRSNLEALSKKYNITNLDSLQLTCYKSTANNTDKSIKKNLTETTFYCARCSKQFYNFYQYRLHAKMHKEIDKRKHKINSKTVKLGERKNVKNNRSKQSKQPSNFEDEIELICNDVSIISEDKKTDDVNNPTESSTDIIIMPEVLSNHNYISPLKKPDDAKEPIELSTELTTKPKVIRTTPLEKIEVAKKSNELSTAMTIQQKVTETETENNKQLHDLTSELIIKPDSPPPKELDDDVIEIVDSDEDSIEKYITAHTIYSSSHKQSLIKPSPKENCSVGLDDRFLPTESVMLEIPNLMIVPTTTSPTKSSANAQCVDKPSANLHIYSLCEDDTSESEGELMIDLECASEDDPLSVKKDKNKINSNKTNVRSEAISIMVPCTLCKIKLKSHEVRMLSNKVICVTCLEKKLTCIYCKVQFQSLEALKNHLKLVHHCRNCSKHYSDLNKHKEKQVPCMICHVLVCKKLSRHFQKKHKKSWCELCNFYFDGEYELYVHSLENHRIA